MAKEIEIIAEIGWNFLGDMSLAEKMITAAKYAGASIAKFQYWDPKTLKKGPWDTDGRREIYNNAALNKEKILKMDEICSKNDISSLFSAFTIKGAQLLNSIGHKKIKIPSHEIANSELIDYSSKNFKFVYLSTGASSEKEVIMANNILKEGSADYSLMHCVSSYPCDIETINLPRIKWLKQMHSNVGFSDHTKNLHTPSIALALGAKVIEKHFTSDNNLPGRDNKFALNPKDFKIMCKNLFETSEMLTDFGNSFQESEKDIIENYRGRWG